jgi:hypothetical protein
MTAFKSEPSLRYCIHKIARVTLATALCLLLNSVVFAQTPPGDLVQRVDDAELARETGLAGYTVTEHYLIFRNGGDQPAATAVVETVYKRGQGKNYSVTSRTGSSFLQKYLIDRVLSEQKGISKGDARKNALITSANYTMQFERDESVSGRDCLVLKLIPREKSPYLIDGQIWVDAHNYHLVRVEGNPSAAPSIWTGLPKIQRDYQELDGFALAKSSQSESRRPVIGTTIVKIDYENYKITP